MDKNSKDIRWHQRLQNFTSAFSQLSDAVKTCQQRELSQLEKQGLIKAFEYTHELAWNVLKDYFEYQSGLHLTGSRDAFREAFKVGLIADGESWMDMIKSRNQTSHVYNKVTADLIVEKVRDTYFSLFGNLISKMNSLK